MLLAAALLVAAFSVWSDNLHTQVGETLRDRSVAYEIDRSLTDVILLQQAFQRTGDPDTAARARSIVSSLKTRIASAQTGAPHGSLALHGWFQSAAQTLAMLEAAQSQPAGDASDEKALEAYQESRARWSGELEAELAAARARAASTSHKLDITIVGLIGSALLLTILQAQELYARVDDEAKKRSDALNRNESLTRDLAASQRELMEVNERFDLALSAARIMVFTQDQDLRYQWVSRGGFGRTAEEFVGAGDDEIFGPTAALRSEAAKREALESRKLVRCEVNVLDRGAPRWIEMYLTPLQLRDGQMGVLGAAIDMTERHLDRESNSWLMRELSHRTQNLLAIVQSMARHTARNADNGKVFISRFRDRLAALSAVHHLLVKSSFRGVAMDDLVRSQLLEAESMLGDRVHIGGPSVVLRPDAAQNLAMGLSELASNALTHGALKNPDGTVDVTWDMVEGEAGAQLKIDWIEHAKGALPAPRAAGFGSVIVTRMLPRSLGAQVKLEHNSEGTICEIVAPLAVVAAVEESAV
ncbi:MAG: signal transduction histidine kinase [Hyphomicrobiales bacterium]|nr:signal transduction histidine kinase [Hyphomicrobiales bacterium]